MNYHWNYQGTMVELAEDCSRLIGEALKLSKNRGGISKILIGMHDWLIKEKEY